MEGNHSNSTIEGNLLKGICQILGVVDGQVYLIDPAQPDMVVLMTTFPQNPNPPKKARFLWKGSALEVLFNEGTQLFPVASDIRASENLLPISSLAFTPLLKGTKVIGFFSIEKTAKPFAISKPNPLFLFLLGQILGEIFGAQLEIEHRKIEVIELKKEVNRLNLHAKMLETTTDYLDKEVDRQYFQNIDLEKQREIILNGFKKFLSPILIEQIVKDPNVLKPGGVRQTITVFFSDIRSFTPMTEKMDPSKIVEFLNEYYSVMTPIVLKYFGLFDKYIGDAIMALFGAPLFDPASPLKAVVCALEMQWKRENLRKQWKDKGFPEFEFGVGINTGEVTIGFLGSESTFSYTAIGDPVNLASRLCDSAKARQTLISQQTAQELGDWIFLRPMPLIKVKGKQQPVQAFEVLGFAKFPPFASPETLPPVLSSPPPEAILGSSLAGKN